MVETENKHEAWLDEARQIDKELQAEAEEAAEAETAPKEKKIPLMELFGPTVQGEGMVIGQRTLFLRFGLCDYRCVMCDSMHAVDPQSVKANARRLTEMQILGETVELADKHNCGWVTLSGGNPAIHNLEALVLGLRGAKIGVAVETQGTLAPYWLKYCDYITCSPKGPGMGEKFEQDKFLHFLDEFGGHPGFSIKVVIFDARDLELASMIAELSPNVVNSDRFYLSLGNPYPPGKDEGLYSSDLLFQSMRRYEELVTDLKDYKSLRTARVLPQLHHWLWANEKGR
jgi:7-carboxy-7-deazaguanine synthase